ncbi:MAG: type III pantothenate kinase [Candidatus Omnitrophica bacterium]|nr:type III pantothenate kinase [Candidatus Omnitrophota bacterium]
MLLAIDVGNTSISVGAFRGKRLVSRGRIPTRGPRPEGRYAAALRALLRGLRAAPAQVDGAIISSVVPRATAALKRALRGLIRPRALVLGENVQAPVINRYRVPSQVGQDRLVNAAAACFLYRGPAIVVDFGTAVTLDLVSRRREYLGGLILPGLEIGLEALAARTALLPRIQLAPPREFLGRDTRGSMRSGLFYGYGALCDGLVAAIKRRHAPAAKVIATGGHAALIAPFCRSLRIINPDLTLQGLLLTYQKVEKT